MTQNPFRTQWLLKGLPWHTHSKIIPFYGLHSLERDHQPLSHRLAANCLEEAYAFTTLKSRKQLDKILMDIKFLEKHAEGIVISVSIKTVIRKSKSLYVVAWTETMYKNSKAISVIDYNGFFKLEFSPIQADENFFLLNPFGIYIDNIIVEKSSEQKK